MQPFAHMGSVTARATSACERVVERVWRPKTRAARGYQMGEDELDRPPAWETGDQPAASPLASSRAAGLNDAWASAALAAS